MVKVIDKHNNIVHLYYKSVWPVSPRDFILFTTWCNLLGGGRLIASRSYDDDPSLTSTEGFVRVRCNLSCTLIQPVAAPQELTTSKINKMRSKGKQSDGQTLTSNRSCCKVTTIAHADLGGNLPAYIVNTMIENMPSKVVPKYKKVLEK